MTLHKYSLVFQPKGKDLSFIDQLKSQLKEKAGWFASCHSKGHITICQIQLEEEKLPALLQMLESLLEYENAQYVYFENFDKFEDTHAFYIAPTIQSKKYLIDKISLITSYLSTHYNLEHLQSTPHITIGRRLNSVQMTQAMEMFKSIDFDFKCEGVLIRKFNPEVRQYEPVKEVFFGNKRKLKSNDQMNLNLF